MNMQKNYLNLETSKVLERFHNHDLRFREIKDDLLRVYKYFPNKIKIINLFSYWLYILSSIKECYGEDGFHIFLSSKNNVFEFSYDFELKINRKSKPIKKNYSFLLKFFFKLNPFLIISNKFYLPGANLSSFFKKIINQLSLSLFNNLSPDHNFNNIQLLKIIIKKYFDLSSEKEILLILDKVPDVFISNIIEIENINEIINLKGCASSFLNFDGYENIFLINKKLYIEGSAHGGGYDIFKNDIYFYFEKLLCDKFYGWGFSDLNVRQYKFKKIKDKISDSKKVFWVDDLRSIKKE